jgi:uncharacterized protein YuzE
MTFKFLNASYAGLLLVLCSTFPAFGSVMYMVDASNNSLYTVNKGTGAATLVGPLGVRVGPPAGLAYNNRTDTLFITTLSSNGLSSIDRNTGAATFLGATGVNLPGLAYDTNSDTLYGLSGQTDSLYAIDQGSGTLRQIGSFGTNVDYIGAAYDALADMLYMTARDGFFAIDTSSGTATLIGETSPNFIRGLEFDADDGVLYGVDVTYNNLLAIDVTTGAASVIGNLGVVVDEGVGLASFATHVPEPSTLAIFALGLMGLASRRFKKQV